mgnify:CR=1 FL=1
MENMKYARVSVAIFVTSAFFQPILAQNEGLKPRALDFADKWNIYTGIDFSKGDYGTAAVDTEIFYAYGAPEAEVGRWRFRTTIPYIDLTGSGGVTGSPGDPIVIGPSGETTQSNSGLVLRWSY